MFKRSAPEAPAIPVGSAVVAHLIDSRSIAGFLIRETSDAYVFANAIALPVKEKATGEVVIPKASASWLQKDVPLSLFED